MSLETNVLRYLANCIEREMGGLAEGTVEMASPTQNEEARMGYDSQVGLPDGRYVLLQFKRPQPGRRTSISFKVPSGQVLALLGPYVRSSFFVLPAVGTNDVMWGAGATLLDCALVVDAWDLYAPFAASMPEGLEWTCGSKSTKTVRVARKGAAGHAASVSQGRGRKKFEPLRSMPISCMCDAGRYGFAVKGGAVLAHDGGPLDRKKYQDAVEARKREYWDSYQGKAKDGQHARGPHASDRRDGEATAGNPDKDVLRAAGSGGRYAIRIGDT